MRIVAVALAGDGERVKDSGTVAGIGMADEEPVLRAKFARADGIFDRVGIEPGVAVAEMCAQRCPVAEQIGAGLTEARLGQHPSAAR